MRPVLPRCSPRPMRARLRRQRRHRAGAAAGAGEHALPGYGHKLGFGLVSRTVLDVQRAPALARRAAHDIVRYEQQGCYSPHQFYVERGGKVEPRAFAHYLAAELANLQHRFPRRALALEEAAAVAGWRQSAELRRLRRKAMSCWVHRTRPGPWRTRSTRGRWRPPAAAAASGERGRHAGRRGAVGGAARPLPADRGHRGAAAELFRLADALGRAGVTRICALGAMTAPEAGWHHDGRFNLADLVRMVEIEQSAERAADALAPYAQEERP